jgi:hypothetical protein|tara:strand:- start:1361 stop:1510 length:150 start_codon:yes stop_codon:yes gene_type:complete
MKKELEIREQFKQYNELFSNILEATYFIIKSEALLFKLEIEIHGNKRET